MDGREAQRPGVAGTSQDGQDLAQRRRHRRATGSSARPRASAARKITSLSPLPRRARRGRRGPARRPGGGPLVAADLAVVHEEVPPVCEGMAVGGRNVARCRRADVGGEERAADLPAQREQVAVRPGRQDAMVGAGLLALAVPADAAAVGVDHRLGFARRERLGDRARPAGDQQPVEERRGAEIGEEAAHGVSGSGGAGAAAAPARRRARSRAPRRRGSPSSRSPAPAGSRGRAAGRSRCSRG